MPSISFPDLPILPVLGDLSNALATHTRTILQALPGAGKTTIAPTCRQGRLHAHG